MKHPPFPWGIEDPTETVIQIIANDGSGVCQVRNVGCSANIIASVGKMVDALRDADDALQEAYYDYSDRGGVDRENTVFGQAQEKIRDALQSAGLGPPA